MKTAKAVPPICATAAESVIPLLAALYSELDANKEHFFVLASTLG